MRPRRDTLLVWTGAPCSYGCSACPIDPAHAPGGLTAETLRQSLVDVPDPDGRLAVLVGGEPFLRPDLLRLIATLRSAGFAPGIVTTGRPLLYPQLRERLRRAGIAYLRVQTFGTGGTHDRAAAVPGAFAQTLAGLRAWQEESDGGCDVDVALNVRHRSLHALVAELEELADALPSPNVQLVIALDPATAAEPDATKLLREAATALARWNDDPARPLLAWEGLPEGMSDPSHVTVPTLSTFVSTAPAACCLGTVSALAQTTMVPQATRANSFNYIRTGVTVPWTETAETCTAHSRAADGESSGTQAVQSHRYLWLVEGERLVLHATDTGDFDTAEITHLKEDWSHVFLDRQPPGVLDDFIEGMRRVLPDPICDPCVHRGQCGRRYQVIEGAPFAREEKWIAEYIAGLRGRVLDVGCGEQLYRDVLAPLVRAGTVQYTGLDPDEPSLDRIRAALPEGRFFLGGIERFLGTPASYDRILCLRSLNHVSDVDEAMARMAALLKPDGQLLIVETTPFAMLRRPEQVVAADRAPRAGHQHFRNVTSEEVLPFARRRSLRAVKHHPASLATTNEWILLLARPDPRTPGAG